MAKVNVTINGTKYTADNNQTVLDVCKEHGIDIPTLCYHEQLEPYGSCFLCTVEIKGARKKYSLSCGTKVSDGMEIQTDTNEIWKQRKMALELLLSNHYADCIGPCKDTCPSNVDVQGYIAAIAEGNYKEAVKIIKRDNPFPSVCGRVCTRPCEDECRRNLVDSRVGIDFLKRYAADKDLASENSYTPPKKPDTGKRIAIVGAGPAGLSCAFYLAKNGHSVDIFEQYDKPGGMVRYGIPEYRQPNNVLDIEIKSITDLGPKIFTNQKLGRDFTLNDLKNKGYDAIFLAIGAHKSMAMGIEGEDAKGAFGGIDFLHDVASGKRPEIGNDVIVIGGGNTAIDTARVSLRLGAKNVTMIYRRTINEMPAHKTEIQDALDEGVKIEFLTNPVRIIKDDNGSVSEIECIRMKLGEPDSSGRRRPLPVEGSNFRIKASSVIFSIGQRSDLTFINNESDDIASKIKFTRKNTIEISKNTFSTDYPGIFAGGDFRRGPDTVIGAIADGKKAAWVIDKYITNGEIVPYPEDFFSKKDALAEQLSENYKHLPKLPKVEMPKLPPEVRIKGFDEVELGFDDEMAHNESLRCLECGCKAVFDCELKKISTEYNVDQTYFKGEFKDLPVDDSHPYITFEPNKCISCSRCIRMCKEVVGLSILGLVNRGFKTIVRPAMDKPLLETECISCGLCADACPTGAIVIKPNTLKPGPFKVETKKTVCPFCSFGCELEVDVMGNKIISIKGFHDSDTNLYGNICKLGRFGFKKIYDTLGENVSWKETRASVIQLANKLKTMKSENTAFFVSESSTLEELYVWSKISEALPGSFICSVKNTNMKSNLEKSFGSNLSPNNYATLRSADVIMAIGILPYDEAVMVVPEIMRRKKEGAKFVYIGKEDHRVSRIADFYIPLNNDNTISDFVNSLSSYIVKSGIENKAYIDAKTDNFAEFKEYLAHFNTDNPSYEEISQLFVNAENTVTITSHTSYQSALLSSIANLLLLTGKIGRNNGGLIVFGESANSEGANILGLKKPIDTTNLEFSVFYNEIPPTEFENNNNFYYIGYNKTDYPNTIRINHPFANSGIFVNAERKARYFRPVVFDLEYSNIDLLIELHNNLTGANYTVDSIKEEMKNAYPYLFDKNFNDTTPDNIYKYYFINKSGRGNFIINKEKSDRIITSNIIKTSDLP